MSDAKAPAKRYFVSYTHAGGTGNAEFTIGGPFVVGEIEYQLRQEFGVNSPVIVFYKEMADHELFRGGIRIVSVEKLP